MPERRVLREATRALGMAVTALLAVVLGLVLLAMDRDPGDSGPLVLGAAFIAAGVAIGLMARRGIEVDPDGVTLRYVCRRRFVRWSEVLAFSVETVRPRGRERQERPVARLMDGEVLILPGADPMWLPSQAPHLVLNELEALRVQHAQTAD